MIRMGTEAAIQLLRGEPASSKQAEQCVRFAGEQGWTVTTILPAEATDEIVRLVKDGYVRLVLMPFVTAEALEVEAAIVAAGGHVAYCRQAPQRRESGIDTSQIICELVRRGYRPDAVAAFLRTSVERVRHVIGRKLT